MKHSWSVWRKWIIAAAIAAPVALLLHELGHFLAYKAYGFPEPVLHYNRASFEGQDAFWRFVRLGDFTSAGDLVPITETAVASVAGLLTTYLSMLIAAAIVARRPSPLAIAFAVTSNIRTLPAVVVLLVTLLGGSASTRDDEQRVAFLTGTPELAFILVGLVIMVVSVSWLIQRIPAGERRVAALGMLIGATVGLVMYSTVVGPLVLP